MGLIKEALMKWLGIVPVETQVQFYIRENTTKELTTLKNQLWYRGDPTELEQFYVELAGVSLDGKSLIPMTRFWAAVPTDDVLIRKFHSGLPKLIVDKLASIVVDDMNEPEINGGAKQRWEDVAKENSFDELLKSAVTKVLAEGDGAFKLCVDQSISDKPLIEFYSGNNVDFIYKRGRLLEIQFFTDYFKDSKRFRLVECYGKGYVQYKLADASGVPVDLTVLPETAELADVVFDGDFIMGLPLKFYDSPRFSNRGDAIYEGKGDVFDALDEIVSTWLDAVRANRVKQYIPESLVPRNESTGAVRKPNVFNSYIVKSTDLGEEADNKIETIQGDISYEGLQSSYVTFLDAALQGIISPSTLGIDVKKLDNAESQREKEKTTLYTRDTLVGVLSKTLPKLVNIVLKTEDNMHNKTPSDYEDISFDWGQYANPSFEATVETVGKARQYGIMSLERCVEELYGDAMTDKDKLEEVERLKGESSVTVDEPGVNDDAKIVKGFGEG
jgi:hypothetical protein